MNRDVIVIGAGCVIAIALGAWLFFSGSSADSSRTAGNPVAISLIENGVDAGGVTERKNYRIRTIEEWQALWVLVHGSETLAPVVDFNQYEVLAVFSGTQPSGGYAVSVSEVSDTSAIRIVHIEYVSPSESCVVSEALTSPYTSVMVPKTSVQIEREETTDVEQCS